MEKSKRLKTKDISYIGAFIAVMVVCSWAGSVPMPVPITLQTMGVFLSVGVLGGKRGSLAVLGYILLGAFGLPVFSGFSGGVGKLLGVTGGYILGFLASALVMWGLERAFGKGDKVLIISMILGLLACYAMGTAWFSLVYTKTKGAIAIGSILSMCVFPFVIPDLVKIGLAFFLSKKLRKHINI